MLEYQSCVLIVELVASCVLSLTAGCLSSRRWEEDSDVAYRSVSRGDSTIRTTLT